ncbi:MAG: electron transfer flavoprotein subunit beta/FixA family protein [Deltaproteobacteria bacterium]|nr:electron transfer flavoprotein subunit beta/FixA family protein [Deltaproteobacteria bacterium]
MHIVVLCKQVPDTESRIKLNADGTGFDMEGIKWILNPYDEYAVEEALKIKEAGKAEKVTVMGLGPDRIVEALRTALAMGADAAVHVKTGEDTGDTSSVAKALADAVKAQDAGLVLAGCRAIDDDMFAVPCMVAEYLGVGQAHVVSKLEVDGGKAKAWRDIDGGAKQVIEMALPGVVTATKGLNEPRYASLPGIMKAKRKPVEVVEPAAGGAKAKLVKCSLPAERAAGRVFEGVESVPEVVRLLREEAKVI